MDESLTARRDGDVPPGSGDDGEGVARQESGRDSELWIAEALTRIEDPVANLPPTAQRVLAGAMNVVATEGFAKLTLSRISAASGENVAAVKYYFGNKAGLVSVLVDAVAYAELLLLTRPPRAVSAARGLSRLVEETYILSVPGKPLRVLFELLPHVIRDKNLRLKLRDYYKTFYELHLEQLGAGKDADPDLRARMGGLAMLLAAVSDGLTMQMLVAPDTLVVNDLLRTLDVLLAHGIPALTGDETRDRDDG